MVKIRPENFAVRSVAVGSLFFLAFLWIVNPLARDAVGINLLLVGIGYLVYRGPEFQDDAIGIRGDNFGKAVGLGIIASFLFFIVTLVVPGLSIGYPVVPASISDSLKFILVVFVAPIVETIFFQGALYAYISNFDVTKNKRKKWKAIIIQAFGMAIFHVGAYVAGFYKLPDFVAGLDAIVANISAFIVVFLFALIAGYIVTRDGVKNLVFVMVFHLGLNFIAFTLSVVTFSIGLNLPLPLAMSLSSIFLFFNYKKNIERVYNNKSI